MSLQTVLVSTLLMSLEVTKWTLFLYMCVGLLQGEVCVCGTMGWDKAILSKQMFLYWVKLHWWLDDVCVPKGLLNSVGVLHPDTLPAKGTICHLLQYQLTKSLQCACSSSIQKWQINPCFSTGCCGWLRHLENHQRFIWACLCSLKYSKPCEHTEWILQQSQTWLWVSSTKFSNVL